MDIFSGDCSKAQILTDGSIDQWDEHAHISPDGSKIVWMSSMGIDQEVEQFKFKSDLWIMNADGSNKQRLTYFNDPGASEYVSGGIVVSDSSWNREGNKLVVFLIDRSGKDEHSIVMIDFENGDERPICGNGICEEGETAENCPEDCKKIYNVKSITTITEYGKSLDWSHTKNLIAFGKHGGDDYYDVYVMEPDGSDEQCLTCDKEGCPQKNNGCPTWHPSGDYIVFTAEKSENLEEHKEWAIPGTGLNCDLWMMTSDGQNFYQLTDYRILFKLIGNILEDIL